MGLQKAAGVPGTHKNISSLCRGCAPFVLLVVLMSEGNLVIFLFIACKKKLENGNLMFKKSSRAIESLLPHSYWILLNSS